MVRKTCERCSKRLTVPVANVEKSGGVTTYDLGLFGNGADLMTNRLSLTHGRLTPKVWEGAAEADLDAIRRRHDPTPEESFEDAEAARRDAVLAYVMTPGQAALAAHLSAN